MYSKGFSNDVGVLKEYFGAFRFLDPLVTQSQKSLTLLLNLFLFFLQIFIL